MGRAAPLTPPFSVPPGEILVQMSDTQRHLNSDLEVVVSIAPCGPETSLRRVGCVPRKMRAPPTTAFLREGSLWPLVTHKRRPSGHLPGPAMRGVCTCQSLSKPPVTLGGSRRFGLHSTDQEPESLARSSTASGGARARQDRCSGARGQALRLSGSPAPPSMLPGSCQPPGLDTAMRKPHRTKPSLPSEGSQALLTQQPPCGAPQSQPSTANSCPLQTRPGVPTSWAVLPAQWHPRPRWPAPYQASLDPWASSLLLLLNSSGCIYALLARGGEESELCCQSTWVQSPAPPAAGL